MTTITTNTAPNALKQRFDAQVAVLAGLAPETELTALFPLLEKIGKVTEGEGRIPFVIVPQSAHLTFSLRMERVALGDNTGVSYLADNRVTNLDDIPKGHYLAIDVEDGRDMLNTNPSVALVQLKRDKRYGGTGNEGISVVTYEPDILRHHYVDLPGSRCDSDGVPYLNEGGRPGLLARWFGDAYPFYGSLSCGGRLGLGT